MPGMTMPFSVKTRHSSSAGCLGTSSGATLVVEDSTGHLIGDRAHGARDR